MSGGYTVYSAGGGTRIVLTDETGRRVAFQLPTAEARKFFRHGLLATAPEPRNLGGHLLRKFRREAGKR